MKIQVINFILLLSVPSSALSQGTDCSSAFAINFDGVLRSFNASSSLGDNVVCNNNGKTPITWFRFTTNASASCPLLTIQASDGQPCEIALYTSCNGNNLEASSSMCFEDGNGLWAPAETYVIGSNKTYYLRVKTSTATTIAIAAQTHEPDNNSCLGATPIDGTPILDNNACHHSGEPEVTPPQLCAFTLENTAFYTYYVASKGNTIINISDIACDNGAANNSSGFQIGFFSGVCGNLTPLNCSSGTGNFVQATTPVLDANTKVFVAVDGFGGSNCSYRIQALNAYILSTGIEGFSAWQTSTSNLLKWKDSKSDVLYFDVQRSVDGSFFQSIGIVNRHELNKTAVYSFEDNKATSKCWYRIKKINLQGKTEYSNIVAVNRKQKAPVTVYAVQEGNMLKLSTNNDIIGRWEMIVFNIHGQAVKQESLNLIKGESLFSKDLSFLRPGQYIITLTNRQQRISHVFVKSK